MNTGKQMEQPYAILITILFITIGLHFYVLEAFTNSIDLMKFALNHPNRFHRPLMAFFAVFLRWLVIFMVVIANAIRIIALCDVL
jgi:hypothetical protein